MYTAITDFRGGLDTRKLSLNLPAGTLIECDNAHINQGAEIEKRKAFVQYAIPYASSFPTFGACGTPSGIFIFGSGSLVAGVAPNGVAPGAFPAPMVYQMLVHPAVTAGTTYTQGTHNLTAVVYSTLFGQFPFVIAKFADGLVNCYYNGVSVADFTSGVVLAYLAGNASGLATAISQLVNQTNNYNAVASGSSIDLYSTPGSSFLPTVTVESLSCITVATTGSQNYPTAQVTNDTGANSPDGSKVTIGGQVYRFKSTMLAAFDVQIGATSLATMQNLYDAIGITTTYGGNWYAGTTKNANVKASLFIQTPNPTFTLTAIALNNPGEVFNGITGISLTEEAPTVNSTVGAQAQGQFQISAGVSSGTASGTVTSSSQPAVNGVIKIGPISYNFQTTPGAASGSTYYVKIGAHNTDSLLNLVLAINGGGVVGTNYGSGVMTNPSVVATVPAGGTVATITAIVAGSAGNSITMTLPSGTTNLTVSGATLTGAVTSGISQIAIGPVLASGTITPSGAQLLDGDAMTIGTTVYRFKNIMSQEWDVQIGVDLADTLTNLILAINGTGTPGTNYYIGTPQNFQVSALPTLQGGRIGIYAVAQGLPGNSIILTSSTAKLVASASTLLGGSASVSLLAATAYWSTGWTVYQFVNQVVSQINAYTATSGFYAKAAGYNVQIYTLASSSFANAGVVSVSTVGQVAIGYCGVQFSLPVGTSSGTVSGISIQGFRIVGTVSWAGTITGTVLATAAAINSNTSAGPDGSTPINQIWVAVPIGQTLYLSNIVTTSQDLAQQVSALGTNFAFEVIGPFSLTAVCSPASLGVTQNGAGNIGFTQTPCICTVSGGFPPYTYNWVDQSAIYSGVSGYSPVVNGQNSAIFQRYETTGNNGAGYYACVVTDSQGNTATSNVILLEQ